MYTLTYDGMLNTYNIYTHVYDEFDNGRLTAIIWASMVNWLHVNLYHTHWELTKTDITKGYKILENIKYINMFLQKTAMD